MEADNIYVKEIADWLKQQRLTVIVGHFGTGKTEVAVNLCLLLGNEGIPFTLADLDVVDPYFRSRECSDMLIKAGGKVITSSQACMDADVPSIPAEVSTVFDDECRYAIMDVGGDASGARVLAQFRERMIRADAHMICILNANRPMTPSKEAMIDYIRSIEVASGLKITGLINNTHMCNETGTDDIIRGAWMAREVSEDTGIPIAMHTISKKLITRIEESGKNIRETLYIRKNERIFPIDIFMKKPWEE